jgi:23S rRNA (guanosine2251-2'-O)-methyltransferase
LRSAAAFDVGAVIATDRNAPQESGTMAKAASGALDIVPMIAVTNLVQAMELLKKAGYWSVGLDGAAKQKLSEIQQLDKKTALVLGAEGQGLRRLTGEHCDFLAKLPISPKMESLNVSNAAAVALYELYRRQ